MYHEAQDCSHMDLDDVKVRLPFYRRYQQYKLKWAMNLVHISNFLVLLVKTLVNQPEASRCI